MEDDEYSMIGNYKFHPSLHSHCLDSINDKLYVFGGSNDIYGIFDLKNKWEKVQNDSPITQLEFAVSSFIPTKQQIIAYDGKQICKIKIKNKSKNKISINTHNIMGKGSQSSFMWYCKQQNRLFIIGGVNKGVYYLDCNDKKKKTKGESKWIKFDVEDKQRSCATDLKYMTAFDGNLLLIIIKGNKIMMALDLKYKTENDKYEWKQRSMENWNASEWRNILMQSATKIVNATNGKYVHFINVKDGLLQSAIFRIDTSGANATAHNLSNLGFARKLPCICSQ